MCSLLSALHPIMQCADESLLCWWTSLVWLWKFCVLQIGPMINPWATHGQIKQCYCFLDQNFISLQLRFLSSNRINIYKTDFKITIFFLSLVAIVLPKKVMRNSSEYTLLHALRRAVSSPELNSDITQLGKWIIIIFQVLQTGSLI